MNDGLATNTIPDVYRTKLSQWRTPSRKIMLTETYEPKITGPAWGYANPLARRHGQAPSPLPPGRLLTPDKMEGTNVSTVFLDGHAEGVDEGFACDIYQIQPDADGDPL